jgi:hypothetical protein
MLNIDGSNLKPGGASGSVFQGSGIQGAAGMKPGAVSAASASGPRSKEDGVYIYIHEMPNDPEKMDHVAVCLAAGLERLKVPVFSNLAAPHCMQRPMQGVKPWLYLFSLTEKNCSVDLLEAIKNFAAPRKMAISMADNVDSIVVLFDCPCLMTHENRFRSVFGRRIPWAFGLSERVMEMTANPGAFEARQPVILRNFSASSNQHVRNMLDFSLVPHLEKRIAVDRRLGSDHVERLLKYAGCLAYGGFFNEDLGSSPYFMGNAEFQLTTQYVTYREPLVILRWDSWRWWESLAAGGLTFHVDFVKYGFMLPVMPKAWEHYVPIDLSDPKGTVEAVMDQRSRWAGIAEAGRLWARTHYSPEAVARRFLDYAASHFANPAPNTAAK